MSLLSRLRSLHRPMLIVWTLLAIEFLDEFVFGGREAAWPLVRDDLHLSYLQIGLLLSIPGVLASVIEPVFGILGDTGRRRALVIMGGVGFAVSCILTALSQSFVPLLLATILFYPSSGAFVALSQSNLMDHDPSRHEHNMARWTFAGSVGVVAGTLGVGLIVAAGLSWRVLFIVTFVMTVLLWVLVVRGPKQTPAIEEPEEKLTFREGVRNAIVALRRREVLRWLTLLQFSELMLDFLLGFLALYFVDVVGVSIEQASLAVAVWTGVGLLGDFLLIPLLERVRGITYLRVSAALEFVLFPLFLIIPGFVPKLIIVALLGFFNAGWYSILQGRLYTDMPGQSGTVLTLNNISGLIGQLVPVGIGLLAAHFGLGAAIWVCLLGPIALIIGLPRHDVYESKAEFIAGAADEVN
jgi:FSR family fosmidomycin resistance protein-like MFS transporter